MFSDHLLFLFLLEKDLVYFSSSRRFIVVSIQPKQIASSISSLWEGEGIPVCFLWRMSVTLVFLSWFFESQRRKSEWDFTGRVLISVIWVFSWMG